MSAAAIDPCVRSALEDSSLDDEATDAVCTWLDRVDCRPAPEWLQRASWRAAGERRRSERERRPALEQRLQEVGEDGLTREELGYARRYGLVTE